MLLLLIQSGLEDLRLPTFGAQYVDGWIVIHPMNPDADNLAALVATGVPVVAVTCAPDDVAVVGFDDIAEAQYAQPPLTTMRTRFDQLGCTAAEHLLAVLRGERDAEPARIFAPTILLCRRSCGCAGLEEISVRGAHAVATSSDWQTTLARQMVQVVSYPRLNPWFSFRRRAHASR